MEKTSSKHRPQTFEERFGIKKLVTREFGAFKKFVGDENPLGKDNTQLISELTDEEKAEVLYDYLRQRRVDDPAKPTHSHPRTVLSGQGGLCLPYALLGCLLARRMGLESYSEDAKLGVLGHALYSVRVSDEKRYFDVVRGIKDPEYEGVREFEDDEVYLQTMFQTHLNILRENKENKSHCPEVIFYGTELIDYLENHTNLLRPGEYKKRVGSINFAVGDAHFRLGNYAESIEALEKAAPLQPNNQDIYLNLGFSRIYLSKKLTVEGKSDDATATTLRAVEDLNHAVELKPDFSEAYIALAEAYVLLGNPKEAIPFCDKALELNPDDRVAYTNRGLALSDLGRHEDAIQNYTIVVESQPNNAYTLRKRGISHMQLGNLEEALTDFENAVDIAPDNPLPLMFCGMTKARLGRIDEARQDLEATKKLFIRSQDPQGVQHVSMLIESLC